MVKEIFRDVAAPLGKAALALGVLVGSLVGGAASIRLSLEADIAGEKPVTVDLRENVLQADYHILKGDWLATRAFCLAGSSQCLREIRAPASDTWVELNSNVRGISVVGKIGPVVVNRRKLEF